MVASHEGGWHLRVAVVVPIAMPSPYRLSSSRSMPTSTARSNQVLLAVDQQGEGAALWVAPELADPVGSFEVGEHQDVEQLGAGNRSERV